MRSTKTPVRVATLVIAAVLPLMTGCSEQPVTPTSASIAEAEADVANTLQPTLSNIRLAISEKNYGSAATQAKTAQLTYPNEPQVHILAAEAEAYLGNAGNAAAAFQRAIDSGLTEPAEALSAAAFDDVRNSEPFARLRASLTPVRATSSAPKPSSSSSDRVRAGDVEIITDETGDYIRAGDLVLDTRQ